MTNGHRHKPSGLGPTGIGNSCYSYTNKNPLVYDPTGIGSYFCMKLRIITFAYASGLAQEVLN